MCQWELIGTHGRAVEWAYARPQRPRNPTKQNKLKIPPFKISHLVGGQRKCQESTFENTLAVSEVVQ